jgi:orotidine-5'-phosphate decarboxylase
MPCAALKKLEAAIRNHRSLVCVGLDTDPRQIPSCLRRYHDPALVFNRRIIAATHDVVCAYKLNTAFYEAHGEHGWRRLAATIQAVPPDVPVILDGKRGDIGNTSGQYARALFDHLGADAVTLSPYMGLDSLTPFLAYRDKLAFILCLTSNQGAGDFQLRPRRSPLFLEVARRINQWQRRFGNCGLVAGATYPARLRAIRALCPTSFFLVPGIGAQQGDLAAVVRWGARLDGSGLVINASRSIIYASPGRDFASMARRQAMALQETIEACAAKKKTYKT